MTNKEQKGFVLSCMWWKEAACDYWGLWTYRWRLLLPNFSPWSTHSVRQCNRNNVHAVCSKTFFPFSLQAVNMLQWVMHRVLIITMAIWGAQGCSNSESCPPPPPNITSKDFCYSARIRSTVLQGLPFGGVPTVLALDFMCFLVSPFCQVFLTDKRLFKTFFLLFSAF